VPHPCFVCTLCILFLFPLPLLDVSLLSLRCVVKAFDCSFSGLCGQRLRRPKSFGSPIKVLLVLLQKVKRPLLLARPNVVLLVIETLCCPSPV
jgi:hypothetical protein